MVAIASDSVQTFWRWFEDHEPELFAFEEHIETIFIELFTQLQKVHEGLCFEFGPITNGRREFSVSAGGRLEIFPAVMALAATAPSLPRWDIREFRQPKADFLSFDGCGFELTTEQLRFQTVADRDHLHLTLYYTGRAHVDPEALEQAAFFMADMVLGEFDMEVFIGRVDVVPGTSSDGRPLIELTSAVANFKQNVVSQLRARAM